MADFTESRNGQILESIINDEPYTAEPQSRIEELLLELKEVIEQGSGSGDGVIRLYDFDGYTEIDSAYTIQQLADYFNDFSEGVAAPLPDIVLLRNYSGAITIYRLCEIVSINSDVAVVRLATNEPDVVTADKLSTVVFGDDGITSISYSAV